MALSTTLDRDTDPTHATDDRVDIQDVYDWHDDGYDTDMLEEFSKAEEVTGRSERSLRALSIADLRQLPPVTFTIESFVQQGSFNLMYGPSGVGKTFMALDMALCTATGTDWHGSETIRSSVLYASAEGTDGLANRVDAWRHGHPGPDPDIKFVTEQWSLLQENDVNEIIDLAIRHGSDFIVIDPLARYMEGADENASKDMGRVVAALAEIRRDTSSTLLVIHHTGKDENRGERGHSALKSAADQSVRLKKGKNGSTITMTVKKSRETSDGTQRAFELEPAGLSVRPVLIDTESAPQQSRTSGRSVTLDILESHDGPMSSRAWKDAAEQLGISKSTYHRHRKELEKAGQVFQDEETGEWSVADVSGRSL